MRHPPKEFIAPSPSGHLPSARHYVKHGKKLRAELDMNPMLREFSLVLKQVQFGTPWGHWPCLEIFLVVPPGGGGPTAGI